MGGGTNKGVKDLYSENSNNSSKEFPFTQMYTATDHVMFSINRNIYNMSPTAKAKETSKTRGKKMARSGGQGCLLGYSNFLK